MPSSVCHGGKKISFKAFFLTEFIHEVFKLICFNKDVFICRDLRNNRLKIVPSSIIQKTPGLKEL